MRWPEYLDALEGYLEGVAGQLDPAGARLAGNRGAPAPLGPRPEEALPAEQSGRALGLLARAEQLSAAGESRREELLVRRQRLEARRREQASGPRLAARL